MKDVAELVDIVTSSRLDNVSAFNMYSLQHEESMFNKFFNGVARKELNSDEEAAQKLYGTNKNDVKYRVLKKRLKERIYNNVLFMNSGKRASNAYYAKYYTLYRHYLAAKFLIGVGAKSTGLDLMGKVIKKANDLELHDIVQQCALQFRQDSMMRGDERKYKYYNKLFTEASEKIITEAKAEEKYLELALVINNSFAVPRKLVKQAQEAATFTKKLKGELPTFKTHFYDYSVQTIYFQITRDFRSAIAVCEDFEDYLDRNPMFDANVRRGRNNAIMTSCYLQLHEYKKGFECAEKGLEAYSAGTLNWYLVMELYFLLALNTGQLKKALEVYQKAIRHERFGNLHQQRQEIWKIFAGYLHFILLHSKMSLELAHLNEGNTTFRYGKLLNEIPHYAKDKKGMNVAVLILQILLLLAEKDFVEIISRTEALKSYIYRNFNKDNTYRSHYFILMLTTMERCQFNKERTRSRTAPLLEKLKKGDLSYSSTQARMEIIPYETLWSIALDMLDE